jgi:hypothetical protein
MWRREERLAYWLSDCSRANTACCRFGSLKALFRKFELNRPNASLHDCVVELCMPVKSLEDLEFPDARAVDGLGSFGDQLQASGKASQIAEALSSHHVGIKSTGLLEESRIRNLDIAPDWNAAVLKKELIFEPAVQQLIAQKIGKTMKVHSGSCIDTPPIIANNPACLLNPTEPIQDGINHISSIPMLLRSIGRDKFKQPAYESFLREAEVLRGVPPGQGELLAVFRNVPVEVVLRLRFVQEKNMIIYTLALPLSSRSTRLHDLAAVRDLSSKVVHLVPHRTRYQTVVLN